MSEFEHDLERLFAQPDEAPDAAAFNAAVMTRIDRRLRLRGLILTLAGLAGAAVAARSILPFLPDLGARALVLSQDANALYATLPADLTQTGLLWPAVGLAVWGALSLGGRLREA